ncbi:MAG: hypothetical protein ACT4RN_01735 [Pseudonocardia sp.]
MERYEQALATYRELMPSRWRHAWSNYSEMDIVEVLMLLDSVVHAVRDGELHATEAGAILAPLTSHPVSTSWLDGELVAIGLLGNDLSQGSSLLPDSEQAYLWSEILACIKRVELQAAS